MDLKKVALAIGLLAIAGVVVWAVATRLGGDSGGSAASGTDQSAQVDDNAMIFTGTTLDGEPFDLEEYRGKPVVVNFWASWCGFCEAEMADLVQFASAHPEAAVIGVAVNDDEQAARAAAADWGLTFPSVFDPDGAIFAEFDGQGLPTTIFFNDELVPVETAVGQTDLAGFEAGLEKAQ